MLGNKRELATAIRSLRPNRTPIRRLAGRTGSSMLKPVPERWRFVPIDDSPGLGILTVDGRSGARGILVPTAAERYARIGTGLRLGTIRDVRVDLTPEPPLLGIIPIG